MKFFKKLRAIFNFKGKRAEMELSSAEIRGDKVFLHPVDDPNHTFCISGKSIDILIDPAVALTEDDFRVIDNEKLTRLHEQMEINPAVPIDDLLRLQTPHEEKQPPNPKDPVKQAPDAKQDTKAESAQSPKPNPNPTVKKSAPSPSRPDAPPAYQPPKMHTISMRLYQEEYDFLMAAIEEKGYKKTEYLLTCVAYAANKKTIETNYQKYYAQRLQRRKEQREAARQAAEEQRRAELKGQVGA